MISPQYNLKTAQDRGTEEMRLDNFPDISWCSFYQHICTSLCCDTAPNQNLQLLWGSGFARPTFLTANASLESFYTPPTCRKSHKRGADTTQTKKKQQTEIPLPISMELTGHFGNNWTWLGDTYANLHMLQFWHVRRHTEISRRPAEYYANTITWRLLITCGGFGEQSCSFNCLNILALLISTMNAKLIELCK